MADWPWAGEIAKEVTLRCRNLAGVVEVDAEGRPAAFRARCRDRWCCAPREGFAAYHRWRLVGESAGAYETAYVPLRPVRELLAPEVNGEGS